MIPDKLLGDPAKKLWIVMSCPKAADKTGPMSSSTGQTFISYLQNAGYSRSDVHFEYIVNEIPHKGGMEAFKARGDNFMDRQVEGLKERIRQHKVLKL